MFDCCSKPFQTTTPVPWCSGKKSTHQETGNSPEGFGDSVASKFFKQDEKYINRRII
jgi:hypothetical protein